MTAYYNEHDPYAAQWLRNLIAAGHIAPGDVDERSIEDVRPGDLAGYTQCHFFAGIGVWSHALRLAGWPDDRRVWTGSCPCQPFSAAGKGNGFADERHLWPAWHWLIAQCQPERIYGEQVASRDGLAWLDLVLTDLEGTGYATEAVDLCAAGVGAPHIRQRLWFVGHADDRGSGRHARAVPGAESGARRGVRGVTNGAQSAGAVGGLASASPPRQRAPHRERNESRRGNGAASDVGASGSPRVVAVGHDARLEVIGEQQARAERAAAQRGGALDTLGNDDRRARLTQRDERPQQPEQRAPLGSDSQRPSAWAACDWLPCRDGKWRPVEPGTFPLAHGAAARVGRLRAYGNAIVTEAAAAWVSATL